MDINLIMHRDTDRKLKMWACRGEGKGCKRNKFRKSQVPCTDCVGPLPNKMTLAQVQAKLEQGDA